MLMNANTRIVTTKLNGNAYYDYDNKIYHWAMTGVDPVVPAEGAKPDITLPDGDGLKTIYVKMRDDVGNETAAVSDTITLNTSIPAVTITGPDKSRISKVTGYDAAAFSFVCDVDFEEYTIRVVPATSSLHTAGTQIPTTGGSTNVSGTEGGYKKNTAINVTVKGADLEAASSGDGTKIVKVFVKNAAGTWSAA